MYERHWRLTKSPFRPQAGAEFFCPLPCHQSALLKLRFVLEQHRASGALIGPTGIGKSFLLRVLQADLPPNISPVVLLNFPCLSPLELIRYLVTELSAGIGGSLMNAGGLDEWLHAWESLLHQYREKNRTPVFIVDDAHLIDDRGIWQMWQLLMAHRERTGNEFSV